MAEVARAGVAARDHDRHAWPCGGGVTLANPPLPSPQRPLNERERHPSE
jgi:hypothetical protein